MPHLCILTFQNSSLCIPEQMCFTTRPIPGERRPCGGDPLRYVNARIGHQLCGASSTQCAIDPPEPISREVPGSLCAGHCVVKEGENSALLRSGSLPVSVVWGCFGLACAAVLMLCSADLINCAGLRTFENTRQQAPM